MPLQFPPAPDDGLIVVDKHLEANERRRRPVISTDSSFAPYTPSMGQPRPTIKASDSSYAPHPVYVLNIDDLLPGGSGLLAARALGYYYVLQNKKEKPCARAHLLTDEFGQSRIASLSFGTYSKDAVSSLKKLAISDRVLTGSYEVRSLRCKPILFSGIWLKALDGGFDLICPLEKKYYLINGDPPYPADDIIAALGPIAKIFLMKYQAFGNKRRADGPSNFAP